MWVTLGFGLRVSFKRLYDFYGMHSCSSFFSSALAVHSGIGSYKGIHAWRHDTEARMGCANCQYSRNVLELHQLFHWHPSSVSAKMVI